MKIKISTVIETDDKQKVFGKGPYLLLTGIARLDSLRAAAAELGIAYSKAFTILKNAERVLNIRLTERTAGGKNGGGSQLTKEGQMLIDRYQALDHEIKAYADQAFQRIFPEFAAPKVGCVVLCSGKSSRFPGDKLLAELHGMPVLARTLNSLEKSAFARRCAVVSTRERANICEAQDFPYILHTPGPVSQSIRLGIEQMDGMDGVLFVHGDQPLIHPESIARMIGWFVQHQDRPIRLSYGGEPASPVLFPARCFPALMSLSGEEGGVRAVLKNGGTFDLCEAESESELLDIDTEDALHQAEDFLK